MELDRSAKIYSALLLAVTTLFVALAFFGQLNQVTGGILIAVFALYVISISCAIYKGITEPPEMSDSDSNDEVPTTGEERPIGRAGWMSATESSPLIGNANLPQEDNKNLPQPLYQHVFQLLFGLLALSLSGYILAHSAGSISDSLQLSGTVFGLTVIAFAATLPEKLISVLSGFRGQGGIVVATTAGSNIFLLTLCVGIVAIAEVPVDQADTFVLFDLVIVWMSALCFATVVFLGPSRIAGLVLLAAYMLFLVLEFTVYKR
jgi:Ca2+/Na+ antiporter